MMRIAFYLCLAAALAGCGKTSSEKKSPGAMTAAGAETTNAGEFQPWTCPDDTGTPPTGELTAQRIRAANAVDDEPRLYEGPLWVDGALYYSDFVLSDQYPSRIRRFTPPHQVETLLDNSGSNGLAVDEEGFLIAASHDRKEISRYNRRSGTRSRLVGQYQGQPFNSPNDLTLTREGVIYFTDPDFQRSAAPGGQPETRVYRWQAGEVTVVDDSMHNPNGIALSPAQDVLYVVGDGENGVLRAYPILDGRPGAGIDLVQGLETPDGMAIDCLGNLYVTEHASRRLRVFSPLGEQLAVIHVDANITNAAFGGPEGKTLYLTGAGAIWSIDLDVAGFPY